MSPSLQPDDEQIRTFLTALWGGADPLPQGGFITLFQLPSASSTYHASVEDAIRVAQLLARRPQTSVHVGCGLARQAYASNQRQNLTDRLPIALPGLWVDIDCADPAHGQQPQALAPDPDTVLAIWDQEFHHHPPTITISSGHGVHLWHLFNGPLVFGPDDVKGVAEMVARWQALVRAVYLKHGWWVDGTYNLDRNLRLPGTINYSVIKDKETKTTRPGVPVLARMLDCRIAIRYGVEEFRDELNPLDWGIDLTPPPPPPTSERTPSEEPDSRMAHESASLIWNPRATYDAELFPRLQQMERDAVIGWERRGKKKGDTSDSGYDMTLAMAAARHEGDGWTPQKVVDLLVHCQRLHGGEGSLKHFAYYRRTVMECFKAARAKSADDDLTDLRFAPPEDPREQRRRTLEALSFRFGTPILRVIRYQTKNWPFAIETTRGVVDLSVADIMSHTLFNRAWTAVTLRPLPAELGRGWSKYYEMIFAVVEDEDVGREATNAGELEAWVGELLKRRHILDSVAEAATNDEPFAQEGVTWISLKGLIRFLMAQGVHETAEKLGPRMKQAGWTRKVFHYTDAEGKHTAAYWSLPPQGEDNDDEKSAES